MKSFLKLHSAQGWCIQMTDKEYTSQIIKNTLFEDIPIGTMISTVDRNGQKIQYAFREEYLTAYINLLKDYIKVNPRFRMAEAKTAFGEYIFNEYRQKVSIERVLIIGLHILIIKNYLKPEGPYYTKVTI